MDIAEILLKHRELVEQKVLEFKGLISPETAAYIVAQEMGLKLEEEKTPQLEVDHLAPGMRRVNLLAKVLTLNPVEEYIRKDGTTRLVQRLIIKDQTGKVGLVAWNPPLNLRVGSILRVKNGYTRDINGGVELVASGVDSVRVEGFEPLRLAEILDGADHITVRGMVLRVHRDRLFQSKRGGVYRASSITLVQERQKARIIFWEEKAEKPDDLEPFQEVEITELQASTTDSGFPELAASTQTEIRTLGKSEPFRDRILTPRSVDQPEIDIDLEGVINSILRGTDRVQIILREDDIEFTLFIVHEDLFHLLKNAEAGDLLLARGIDIRTTSESHTEARSTIWADFEVSRGNNALKSHTQRMPKERR